MENVRQPWNVIAASLPLPNPLIPPALKALTNQLTSSPTNALIGSIVASDLTFLHRLLFPPRSTPTHPTQAPSFSNPLLVNRADSNGWSPIHHCAAVSHPSIVALDSLYMAGADVSLFTTREQFTPLHVLALRANIRSNTSSRDLYLFAIHLIRDLRAPLSARDKDDNTCIHLAAERGQSLELLNAFLECDSTGYVRTLRNSDGYIYFFGGFHILRRILIVTIIIG